MPTQYPTTPDGRYFVVNGKLWRCTDPHLDEETRKRLVNELMSARRAVKTAKQSDDEAALNEARRQVNEAKVALGERGDVWWNDGAPDYSQMSVKNTPYADWYKSIGMNQQ